MSTHLGLISFLVRDYDEAIAYFLKKLSFKLVEDKPMEEGKRWVVVAPPGRSQCNLLLAKAKDDQQRSLIGRQAGGRVFLFLYTINFWADYRKMLENGVDFQETPRKEVYGLVVVFRDLYGNPWDLLQLIEGESLPDSSNY